MQLKEVNTFDYRKPTYLDNRKIRLKLEDKILKANFKHKLHLLWELNKIQRLYNSHLDNSNKLDSTSNRLVDRCSTHPNHYNFSWINKILSAKLRINRIIINNKEFYSRKSLQFMIQIINCNIPIIFLQPNFKNMWLFNRNWWRKFKLNISWGNSKLTN